MVKVFHFVMKQSYICALIAMMVSLAAQTCPCAELLKHFPQQNFKECVTK